MPPIPPPTFVGRIAFHLKSDDDFRTAIDAFMASFAVVATVSASTSSFVFGILASLLTILIAYLFARKRVFTNKSILMPAALLGCVSGFSTSRVFFSRFQAVAVSLAYSVSHEGEVLEHLSHYFLFLSMFHFTEFVFTALTNRRTLRPDSFLLNHSVGYWLAASISWIEFLIEVGFFEIKTQKKPLVVPKKRRKMRRL